MEFVAKKMLPGNYLLAIVFALSSWSGLPAQPGQHRFSHLTIDDGLSNNQVNCIFKDRYGFIWFGTMAGLNRFDGRNFLAFRNNRRDTFSIGDNFVSSLFEDQQGRLWAGTRSGFNIFDPVSEKFYRHPGRFLDSLGISDHSISKIYRDESGNYWYLSPNSGMYEYQADSGRTTHHGHTARKTTHRSAPTAWQTSGTARWGICGSSTATACWRK